MKKQLNKQLSLILCFLMVFSAFVPVFGASDYESHWAKDAIQSAINSGIVAGYPDGSFKPEKAVTRAEFFSLVNNAFQFTTSSAVMYTDVAANAWYAPIVAKAQAAGYISGYPDGTIKPDGNITRQEAAVVLSRLKSLTAVYQNLAFTDASAIGDWSRLAVIAVVEAKIMIGYPDGRFQPQAQIKRAEALVAINNCVNYPGINVTKGTVYDKAGIFGSSQETTTIDGDVIIKAAGVTLQNTIVNGNLTIAKEVGEGDVTLQSVTVKGDIHVNGGGSNSIYFINVTTGKVYVMKDGGPVRIVASGTTEIDEVIVGSDVILEEVDLTGEGFVGITVESNAAGGIDITLINVKCDSVDIMAEGVTLNVDSRSTIGTLTLDEKATIKGTGVITEAIINASGVTFQKEPAIMTVAPGVTAPTIVPVSSGGGGGGGGGGSTNVEVSAITNADVSVTTGSIKFNYAFTDADGAVTYAVAKSAPYYLNLDASSVTITNGIDSTTASLTNLAISDDGTVTYADLAAVQTKFTNLTFVPSQILIHLVGASSVNSGANAWTKDVTVTLDSAEIALLTPAPSTAPSAVTLGVGSTAPVGGVTNVAIPAAGLTDTTGAVTDWMATTASNISFTVSDVTPAVSTILINGDAYTNGADYTIAAAAPLTIVVTTTEAGKIPGVRTFTIAVTAAPVPVADFANTAVTTSSATFTWTAAAGAASVTLEQSPAGSGTWTDATTEVLTAESTTATASGLDVATAYDFRLIVSGGANEGTSNVVANITTITIPVADFLHNEVTDTTATFTWTEAAAVTTSVKIQQSLTGLNAWMDSTAVLAAASGTVTGLTASTDYDFRLVVVGGVNAGTSNVEVDITTNPTPGTVATFAITGNLTTDTTATFTWTAATGATSVNIQQSLFGTGTWTDAATAALDAASTTGTVTGLTPGETYDFRLFVVGGSFAGASNTIENIIAE